MTGRDKFPFGKPAKEGLTLDDVDEGYIAWLEKQDWWTAKDSRWKAYRAYYQAVKLGEDDELVEPKEREILSAEKVLLADASPDFIAWWRRAYGERLRKDGEVLYIAHLRVAKTAWNAGLHSAKAAYVNPIDRPSEVAIPIDQSLYETSDTAETVNDDTPDPDSINF